MHEKKVVIYCRVSTKEQAEEGNSLVTQEKICREYATRGGLTVAKVFIEFGESAKTANRTELLNMLEYCSKKQNKINMVIVYKVDRLARNVDDYCDIRMRLKNYGIIICSTSEQFDGNPAGRFMENILANVAQFDNDVRTERSVNGMKEAVKAGRYIWLAPYGYKNGILKGKSNIIKDPLKASLIRETFHLIINKGEPLESIRIYMLSRGLLIGRSQFNRLLRNKVYCGLIEKFNEVNRGSFEAIISVETFEKAAAILNAKKRKHLPYKTSNPDFPLRRFIKHPSGIKITGGWSTGKSGRKFAYYRFALPGQNFSKELLEDKFSMFISSFAFNRKYLDKLIDYIKITLQNKKAEKSDSTSELQEKLHLLQRKQTAILDKNLNGYISNLLLKTEIERLEIETLKIEQQLLIPKSSFEFNDIGEILNDIQKCLANPGLFWKQANYEMKIKFQGFKFPQGVLFDGENFRTQEIAPIFQVNSNFYDKKSLMVPHTGKKLNTVDSRKLPSSKEILEIYLPELKRLKEQVFD